MVTILNIFFLSLSVLLITYLLVLHYLRRGLEFAPIIRNSTNPHISIIVSMHNEAENARDCIQCLLAQKYPPENLEIIIVDDRSTDGTAQIIRELSYQAPNVHFIQIDKTDKFYAPKKYAIDQAVRKAKGEIIVLTDADGRPGPEWVNTIVSSFETQVGMVIGYAPYSTDSPFNTTRFHLLSLEYLSHAAIACASTGLKYPLTCVGTNMAYRKIVYEQLDGFGQFRHIHTGDDDLFLQRVREETKWDIVYNKSPEGQVWNAPPATFKKFFHQRLRYASKGFMYPRKITVALLAVYLFNLLVFISPLSLFSNSNYLLVVLVILFLKALGDYVFLRRAASVLKDRRHLNLFPFAFILHIPYVLLFGLLSQIKQFEWGSRRS